jgi:hypothetical protein
VSWFDQVTSFLAASILLLGSLVFVLLLLWIFSGNSVLELVAPIQIARGASQQETFEPEFLPPSAEETVEFEELRLQQQLLAVTDAASRIAGTPIATLASLDQASQHIGTRELGPNDRPSPNDTADLGLRAQRWTLVFKARDVDSYARQLDHYQIELGVMGGGLAGVDYASQLSSPQPLLRHGEADHEQRLYLLWTYSSPLKQFEQVLLQRGRFASGDVVTITGREVLKFIPPELDQQLAALQLEYAAAKGYSTVEQVAKTVFTSNSRADGYQFQVTQQRYKKTR